MKLKVSSFLNLGGLSIFFADHVFDESSTNASVYELLTKDIIHAAVEGFNGNLV